MVDRAERLPVLLVLVSSDPPGTGEKLVGLAIDLPGWTLRTGKSLFTIGRGWEEVFPELVSEPPSDSWREAWQTWCQGHGFPFEHGESWTFRRCGPVVQVTSPGDFLSQLKANRGEVLGRDTWLLAGKDCFRALAKVELNETVQQSLKKG
jgi:hypothetical protein